MMKGHHMAVAKVIEQFNRFHIRSAGLAESVLWIIAHHPERDSDLGLEIIRDLVASYQVELNGVVMPVAKRRG